LFAIEEIKLVKRIPAKVMLANLPEYDVRVSVLGHMQRGGSPSCFFR
jgi:6-phosphofructokinase